MDLPGWQLAYITVVIYAAPAVAAVLLWSRYRLAGAWLLAASMAGAFVFGILLHFLVPGADNVFTQPPGTWQTAFRLTAVLLPLVQVAGGFIGFWAARGISRASAATARKRPAGGPAGSRRGDGWEPR